ncbi:senescence-associated [Labeo rohita]|uniref:Senescence-associated n=1 Tax=Labeo rohita TaxID=84645 RepID=A0A498NMH4_LABRO|nr:senescence-associated [Labeo rohita]
MPRSDDRCARQDRCGPPPGFPLASPCPGIVHHLSGTFARALAPPAPARGRGTGRAGGAPPAGAGGSHLGRREAGLHLHCAVGARGHPLTRARVRLLGPCFKTGRVGGRPLRGPRAPVVRGPDPRPGGAARPRRTEDSPPRRAPAPGARGPVPPRGERGREDTARGPGVLFNFPSRYLSTIGLVPVFSLRWSLPPALGCIPKQPDSEKNRTPAGRGRYRPHTVHGLSLHQKDLGPRPAPREAVFRTPHFPRRVPGAGIRRWAPPSSLAATEGILPVGGRPNQRERAGRERASPGGRETRARPPPARPPTTASAGAGVGGPTVARAAGQTHRQPRRRTPSPGANEAPPLPPPPGGRGGRGRRKARGGEDAPARGGLFLGGRRPGGSEPPPRLRALQPRGPGGPDR